MDALVFRLRRRCARCQVGRFSLTGLFQLDAHQHQFITADQGRAPVTAVLTQQLVRFDRGFLPAFTAFHPDRQLLDFELCVFGDRARARDRVSVPEQLRFDAR